MHANLADEQIPLYYNVSKSGFGVFFLHFELPGLLRGLAVALRRRRGEAVTSSHALRGA